MAVGRGGDLLPQKNAKERKRVLTTDFPVGRLACPEGVRGRAAQISEGDAREKTQAAQKVSVRKMGAKK